MPMVGRPIVVDGVVVGRACSRERARYCKCGRRASLLCDFPLKGKKAGKTCDANLCQRCTTRVARDTDYCPAHAAMHKANQKEKGEAAPTPGAVDSDPTRGVASSSVAGKT